MRKLSTIIYSLFPLWILYSLFQDALHIENYFIAIGLLTLALLFIGHSMNEMVTSHIGSKQKLNIRMSKKKIFYRFLAIVSGACITFILNHSANIDAVLASSMIGLASAWTFREYSLEIYCGTFIGMACNQVFNHPFYFLFATVLSGLLYILSQDTFGGWGGRAGFIAFVGTYSTSLLFGLPIRTLGAVNINAYLAIFFFASIACLSTFAIQSMERMDVVSASALIGLTMAILYPDASHLIVLSAFCGSFTGMTNKAYFPKFSQVFLSALLTGFLFVAGFSLFDGTGGKLGALAFIATGATNGFFIYLRLLNSKLNFSSSLFRSYLK